MKNYVVMEIIFISYKDDYWLIYQYIDKCLFN